MMNVFFFIEGKIKWGMPRMMNQGAGNGANFLGIFLA